MVDRGKHFVVMHRTIYWMFRILIRGANDLAVVHTTARQKGHRFASPMITTSLFVDLRRPYELTPNHYSDIVLHTTFM